MSNWIEYYGCRREDIGIIDEAFRLFLDACWPYVDYFTFSSCRDDVVSQAQRYGDFCELKKELTPYFAGRSVRHGWFGYGFSHDKEGEMCIYRYRATKEAKEVILSCYRDLLLHFPTNRPGVKELRRFDDLCLFSQGRLFLGTVSHEYQVCLYPLTIQMRSLVTSLAIWHPCKWCDECDRRNIHKYNWTDEPSPI